MWGMSSLRRIVSKDLKLKAGRAGALAAPVTAAYVAFLVHTGGDWTWQLPGVGLAAIACGAACIGLTRNDGAVRLGMVARGAGIAVAIAIAFVGAAGA